MAEYNFARRHSTLGCTPFEAWAAHGIVPRKVDESLLARCCPEAGKGTYKVQRQGVHVEGRYYTGLALAGRVGDRVIVRRPSPDSAEVYAFAEDRTYLGALVPHAKLNDKERDAIIRHRVAHKEVTDSFFVRGHAVREEYNRDFVESNIAEIAERLEAEAAAGESIESSDAWAKDHRDMEDLDKWVSPDLDREARP